MGFSSTIPSYFLLQLYMNITGFHDEAWRLLTQILRFGFLTRIQKFVALLIWMKISNCPEKSIEDICPNENVTFWLFNNHTDEPYQLLEYNITNLENAPFISDTPIKFLVHGFGGHRDHDPNPQIRPHYLEAEYNVISVDLSRSVAKPCYSQAVAAVPIAGKCLGEFLATLLKHNKDVNVDWVHFIGFSLGAHVTAYACQNLGNKGIYIPRMTVLDAAAPMFYTEHNFTDGRCAGFIDAVHTNVGIYGKTKRVGDVDFYVNYLLFQRGCSMFDVSCNHAKAAEYFGESITTETGFWGYPLQKQDHLELMGEYTPSTAQGSYYVSTNDEEPYATGFTFPEAVDSVKSVFKNSLKVGFLVAAIYVRVSSILYSVINLLAVPALKFIRNILGIRGEIRLISDIVETRTSALRKS